MSVFPGLFFFSQCAELKAELSLQSDFTNVLGLVIIYRCASVYSNAMF